MAGWIVRALLRVINICVHSKSGSSSPEKDLCGRKGHHWVYPQPSFPSKGKGESPDLLKFLDCSGTVGQEKSLLPIKVLFTALGKNVSLLEIDLKAYQEILKRKSCKELTTVTSFIMSYIVLLQFNNSWRYYAGLRHKFPVVVSCSVLWSGSWSQTFYKQLL